MTINEDSPGIPYTLCKSVDDVPRKYYKFYVFVIYFRFFSSPRCFGQRHFTVRTATVFSRAERTNGFRRRVFPDASRFHTVVLLRYCQSSTFFAWKNHPHSIRGSGRKTVVDWIYVTADRCRGTVDTNNQVSGLVELKINNINAQKSI